MVGVHEVVKRSKGIMETQRTFDLARRTQHNSTRERGKE